MVENNENTSENEELNISKSQRRRSSIFYVPLLTEIEKELKGSETISSNSKQEIMPPPCGFNWSMTGNDVDFEDDDDYTYPQEKKLPPSTPKPEHKRYGVLIGSLTLNDSTNTITSNHSNNKLGTRNDEDDSNLNHQQNNHLVDYDDSEISRMQTNTSTPIVQMKSRSRNNILSVSNTSSSLSSSSSKPLTIKEKSSTLPQAGTNADNAIIASNAAASSSYFVDVPPTNTFPPKNKVTVVSSPIHIQEKSSASRKYSSDTSITSTNMVSPAQTKKPLSFIRRTHSTKVARSNSILKTFTTTKGILSSSSGDNVRVGHSDHDVHHLPFELLNKILCSDVCGELLKSYFVKRNFSDRDQSCSLIEGEFFSYFIFLQRIFLEIRVSLLFISLAR